MINKHVRPLVTAGFILGVGMGGFVDGILFHQLLQLHNMLSNQLPPTNLINVEIGMFWDGLFHVFTWTMTLIGIILLWQVAKDKNVPKSTPIFAGWMLIGFGTFNVVEGLIDHEILQIHHVLQRVAPMYQYTSDAIFIVFGLMLIYIGSKLFKTGLITESS